MCTEMMGGAPVIAEEEGEVEPGKEEGHHHRWSGKDEPEAKVDASTLGEEAGGGGS